jgi:hypothetical protein
VQKRNRERKKCEEKERKKRRSEEINTSKVVEVISLNLDLL